MDARSIAATAARGGRITPATELDPKIINHPYVFDTSVYEKRVYDGWGKAKPSESLILGPNIKDWPSMPALQENLLVKIVSYITDPVTTTDELIPSGETASYRSNPLGLAEFTLSRKDPGYVGRAKAVHALEQEREAGKPGAEFLALLEKIRALPGCGQVQAQNTGAGSAIFARKPGDGSAREQAASCQRVLGGAANFALEYATKRYRSNLINWGILPFVIKDEGAFKNGDWVFLPDARKALLEKKEALTAWVLGSGKSFTVTLGALTDGERQILADGCLINYYAK
jgi:aconitate hydratase